MTGDSGATRHHAALAATGLALALVVSGCGAGSSSRSAAAPATSPTAASTRGGPPRFEPTRADFRAVKQLMARQAKALMQHDEVAYLATVDHRQPGLVRHQRTLYSNIAQLPLASLSYGVDTSASLVPAPVPGDDPVLHPAVVEHLKLTGTFDRPVSNPVDMTFVRRHGHWLLASESEAKQADHFDTPQERPWYGVPIVAQQVGSMTVLVDQSQAGDLSGLTTAVQDDIAYDAHLLGVPASSKILVDATTNGLSLNFSSLSKEEAAAVTFGVTSTDDLGEQQTGLAGMVIKVNPHTVDQVVHDKGIMRHELTHYLLRQYSGALPKWLSEGVATWVQFYPDDFSQWQVSDELYGRLMRADRTLPIIGLFNEDPSLNYPISQAAVAWLVKLDGVAQLLDLMRAYRSQYAGADVDALTPKLLRQVYGVAPAQVTDGAWGLLAQFDH
jgi:hypothetical protein